MVNQSTPNSNRTRIPSKKDNVTGFTTNTHNKPEDLRPEPSNFGYAPTATPAIYSTGPRRTKVQSIQSLIRTGSGLTEPLFFWGL
jgi:hypothetical protein